MDLLTLLKHHQQPYFVNKYEEKSENEQRTQQQQCRQLAKHFQYLLSIVEVL
jgi:hypothetical protein